jgi:fido (protein-threonine AMPylation protein)
MLSFVNVQLYVQKGQLDAKMLGALLTGVNRAFPFLKGTGLSVRVAGMPVLLIKMHAIQMYLRQCPCFIISMRYT